MRLTSGARVVNLPNNRFVMELTKAQITNHLSSNGTWQIKQMRASVGVNSIKMRVDQCVMARISISRLRSLIKKKLGFRDRQSSGIFGKRARKLSD